MLGIFLRPLIKVFKMQIPFHKTHTTQEEIDVVVDAMKSGWLTMGPKTIEFENKFRDFLKDF